MRAYQSNQREQRNRYNMYPGESFELPAGASVTFHSPYAPGYAMKRLWVPSLNLPIALHEYLDQYRFPIRYSYVKEGWPLSYYQTVSCNGNREAQDAICRTRVTPSTDSPDCKGIQITPLLLHTGVASAEHDQPCMKKIIV